MRTYLGNIENGINEALSVNYGLSVVNIKIRANSARDGQFTLFEGETFEEVEAEVKKQFEALPEADQDDPDMLDAVMNHKGYSVGRTSVTLSYAGETFEMNPNSNWVASKVEVEIKEIQDNRD